MFARRRPLLRAAVVGGGAYMVGKKSGEHSAEQSQPPGQQPQPSAQQSQPSAQQSQQSQQSQQQAGPAAGQTTGQGADQPPMGDQLKQLSDLHAQGALTDAEFAQAKSRLLGG